MRFCGILWHYKILHLYFLIYFLFESDAILQWYTSNFKNMLKFKSTLRFKLGHWRFNSKACTSLDFIEIRFCHILEKRQPQTKSISQSNLNKNCQIDFVNFHCYDDLTYSSYLRHQHRTPSNAAVQSWGKHKGRTTKTIITTFTMVYSSLYRNFTDLRLYYLIRFRALRCKLWSQWLEFAEKLEMIHLRMKITS